jgi:UDP-2,4-diacetamido-2,4,6-trideoxy-beta-L-altropyranose hydrolase
MTEVVFRCDASHRIGAGHLTRCLALAEALHGAGWRVTFAARSGTSVMMKAVSMIDFLLYELECSVDDEAALLRNKYSDGVDLLVVDHYGRGFSFEQACRGWAKQILVLDDATGRNHDCDILIDAAASDGAIYAGCVPDFTRVLFGPSHAMVRRSFINCRSEALRRRRGCETRNILISFGATDPKNVTAAALNALADLDANVEITVALSSQALHVDELRSKATSRIRVVLDADTSALMTNADLAIGAAGATSYERAVLGLPSIIVALSDDQRGVARRLIAAGAAIDAGDFDENLGSRLSLIANKLIADSAALAQLSCAAAALIDGRGVQRIMAALAGIVPLRNNSAVSLRLAEKSDQKWLLRLQEKSPTRRHARNPAVPTAEEHSKWFSKMLANADVFFLLIEVDGECAGSVRLDPIYHDGPDAFEISIAVDPNFHGRGIGAAALLLARRALAGAAFEAEILPENIASQRLFSAAGFRKVAATRYRQSPRCSFGEHAR